MEGKREEKRYKRPSVVCLHVCVHVCIVVCVRVRVCISVHMYAYVKRAEDNLR